MTKSKFQLVGSLLRPADLRKYKDEIEHRDDIQYPFYDASTVIKKLKLQILSKLWLTNRLTVLIFLLMVSLGVLCGTWTLSGVSKVLNATLLSTVIHSKTTMADNMRLVKILVFVSLNHSQVKPPLSRYL